MKKYLLVAVAVLAIAGCSKKNTDTDGDGKISDSEAKAEMAKGGALAMKPGEWEIQMTVDTADAKGLTPEQAKLAKSRASALPPIKTCITKEQVEKPGGDFFGAPSEANCTFQGLERSGNSMKVAMTCKPMDKMIISTKLEGQFGAESYSMTMEQKTESAAGVISTKGKIDGRRIGDCPA